MIRTTQSSGAEPSIRVRAPDRRQFLAVIIVLLLALAGLSSIAVYQASHPPETGLSVTTSISISTTTISVSPISTSNSVPTKIVTGFLSFNFSGMPDSRVEWVNFTTSPLTNVYPPPGEGTYSAVADSTGQYWVAIPANMEVVGVALSFRSTIPCLFQCPAVSPNTPPHTNNTFKEFFANGTQAPISSWCYVSPVTHISNCSPVPPSQWFISWSGYTSKANQTASYAEGGCSGEISFYVSRTVSLVEVMDFNCP